MTILERSDQILPREDADVAAIVQQQMQEEGVAFEFNARLTRAERRVGEKVIHFE